MRMEKSFSGKVALVKLLTTHLRTFSPANLNLQLGPVKGDMDIDVDFIVDSNKLEYGGSFKSGTIEKLGRCVGFSAVEA